MKIEERDSNWDFPRIIFCLNSLHSLKFSNRMPYKGSNLSSKSMATSISVTEYMLPISLYPKRRLKQQ